jgi:hypothetical protein
MMPLKEVKRYMEKLNAGVSLRGAWSRNDLLTLMDAAYINLLEETLSSKDSPKDAPLDT